MNVVVDAENPKCLGLRSHLSGSFRDEFARVSVTHGLRDAFMIDAAVSVCFHGYGRPPGMNSRRHPAFLFALLVGVSLLASPAASSGASKGEARVTQIVRDVKVLPEEAQPRAAAVNERVAEGDAVRTGDASRSELTFADLTISRLGANTIYSFNRAGRDVRLTNGSILLRVPKGSGGGNIRTDPVTVAVTGTTVIFEHARAGKSKLIVLEGGARLSLTKVRGQSRDLRAGQMLEVPAGATTLGMPVDINIDEVMKTHPLITNFRPLPSRDLITAAARDQANREPVYDGQPASNRPRGPAINIGIGGLFGGGPRVGGRDPRRPPRGQQPPSDQSPNDQRPRSGR